jgi:hypothetical protein
MRLALSSSPLIVTCHNFQFRGPTPGVILPRILAGIAAELQSRHGSDRGFLATIHLSSRSSSGTNGEDKHTAMEKKEALSARTRRAKIACIGCRNRKVRCDVTHRSAPCTNCFLDDKECVIEAVARMYECLPTPLRPPLTVQAVVVASRRREETHPPRKTRLLQSQTPGNSRRPWVRCKIPHRHHYHIYPHLSSTQDHRSPQQAPRVRPRQRY